MDIVDWICIAAFGTMVVVTAWNAWKPLPDHPPELAEIVMCLSFVAGVLAIVDQLFVRHTWWLCGLGAVLIIIAVLILLAYTARDSHATPPVRSS